MAAWRTLTLRLSHSLPLSLSLSLVQVGDTPLHRAAYIGRVRVVELLLRHGADKTAKNQVQRE